MRPFLANGRLWRVVEVEPGDPRLIDRTMTERLATTDPATGTINVSSAVKPPLLDRVVMHEVAHAVTISYGLVSRLRAALPPELWVFVEEWAAQLVEMHAIEVSAIASETLGRPVCVHGRCSVELFPGKGV